VEDWAQDLLIHLRYLPAASKHREAGKEDIVQTFDPCKHHGANSARFFNYINLCLGNRFRTMYSARMKNPICRAGNVSLGGHFDESDSGQVDDEFCHTHSAYFRGVCHRQERRRDASHTLTEFVEFLRREDAGVLPVMGAIAVTTTPAAATELLGRRKRTSAACARGCASWAGASRQVIPCLGNGDRIGVEREALTGRGFARQSVGRREDTSAPPRFA
jgi:hypothetical protein